MSPDEYWNGEPCLAAAYREAWKMRQRENNRNLWLQGHYFYEALCDVSPVLHAFAPRGTKPMEYLKEPVALTKEELNERKERDERRAYEDAIARTRAWAERQNTQIKDVRTDGQHD